MLVKGPQYEMAEDLRETIETQVFFYFSQQLANHGSRDDILSKNDFLISIFVHTIDDTMVFILHIT